MNKEFMVLSDDSFVVMDEFGHIEKRIYCNNDIESILLSENKIEMLTNKINSLNKKYSEYNMGVSLSTKMIKATPFIILLTTLMGFVLGYFCSVGNFFYGMYSGLLNLIISSFAGGIEVVYFSVVKNEIKKKIKKLDLEINSDVVLKKQKIKELEQIKSKKCDISKLNIIKNDPISIVKKTDTVELKINEELREKYEEHLNDKPKKLVLNKKKK